VSRWLSRCSHVYCGVARRFPHDFRMICGDGLERLGEDVVPLVYQQQGTVGVMRLFADLALPLPYEYFSSWFDKLQEVTMAGDPFEGTWRSIQAERTQWPAGQPQPQQACLRFEPTETGYLMVAYGIVDGQAVAERPQSIVADGRRRPVVDLNGRPIPGVPAGAMAFGTRPDAQTLEVGAEVDGKVLGAGTYRVSPDGRKMTVTNEGMSLKGPFKLTTVFERVPDPEIAQPCP
jgi:hypothetical protein